MHRLHLFATEADDLPPLSALLQDAIVRAADIGYDRRTRRFALLVARYRWEEREPSRVRALITVGGVLGAHRLAWPTAAVPLDLLALRPEHGALRLDFAGGAALRLTTECLDLALDDVGEAWPVKRVPGHGH